MPVDDDLQCVDGADDKCHCRAAFAHITFRTLTHSNSRSIVGFGPDCDYIRLEGCELAGHNGLLCPFSKGV